MNEIFISFKCRDENKNFTKDYEIAKDLYAQLTQKGYSVFFSTKSLEIIGSSRYKADIDAALDQAKILIVVGTNVEYMSSQWVRYEWDSFYNDFLSGIKKDAALFTLTQNISTNDLPRTLRNVQNFEYPQDLSKIFDYVSNLISVNDGGETAEDKNETATYTIITGKQVTYADIESASELDKVVYEEIYRAELSLCKEWYDVNPDIYVMAKDNVTGKILAYINIAPITDECYENIKNGDFIDTALSPDMILSYDMPYPYNLYFASIVIHPDYQNSGVLFSLFNAAVEKFLHFGRQEVYIKRMLADAVTLNGKKFCQLFGMQKIKSSNHDSSLYEVSMLPPKFRAISQLTRQLYEYYEKVYNQRKWLFED